MSAAWTARPFDLDNYTSTNCLCPATATGGKCPAGSYCPEGSPEPTPCPPGSFCATSGESQLFSGQTVYERSGQSSFPALDSWRNWMETVSQWDSGVCYLVLSWGSLSSFEALQNTVRQDSIFCLNLILHFSPVTNWT